MPALCSVLLRVTLTRVKERLWRLWRGESLMCEWSSQKIDPSKVLRVCQQQKRRKCPKGKGFLTVSYISGPLPSLS